MPSEPCFFSNPPQDWTDAGEVPVEFLSAEQVRARAEEVRQALAAVLDVPAVAGHPQARQWEFLRACLGRLLGREAGLDTWEGLSSDQAAQLKFEIQEKLKTHYERRAGEQGLVLSLVHSRHLSTYRLAGAPRYPRLAGYCLLVREPAQDATLRPQVDRWSDYLVRVVTEAAEAEYRAYEAVPEVDERPLERWAWAEGPYHQDVLKRLRQRRGTGWVLNNAYNPSTHRTEEVEVRWLDDAEARLSTREFWHLRWWNTRTREYIYAYEERLRYDYLLRRRDHAWRVWERQRRATRRPCRKRSASRRA